MTTSAIVIGFLFVVYFIFLTRKKNLANRMVGGVDIIKLVLYKVVTNDFLSTYGSDRNDYCKTLAAATINEIFGCQNTQSQKMFIENTDIVLNEIRKIGTDHSDLKQPITDAIRVNIQANYMLTGKLQKNWEEIFKNAMVSGLFNPGGNPPDCKSFLQMAVNIGKKYIII